MKFVHAFGYALGALLASIIGTSMAGHLPLAASMGVIGACTALGAYVGWNRTKTSKG